METKRWLKKTLTLLLAATMTLAIGITAVASDGVTKYSTDGDGNIDGVSSVTVSKTLNIDDDVELPEETNFTVSVSSCEDVDVDGNGIDEGKQCGSYDDNVVYVGITGGLKSGTISEGSDGSWSGTLEVDVSAFKNYGPGVYHYLVSETDSELGGMVYDETVYDAYVYVYDDGSGNLYVAYVVITKDIENDDGTTTQKKSDLSFVNTYDTASLKLEKNISGTQADSNGKWNFTITITGCYVGQKLTVNADITYLVTSGDSVVSDVITCSNDTVVISVSLGNGDTIEILGLTCLNEYTIEEEGANSDGYSTTYSIDDEDKGEYSSTGITGVIEDSDNCGSVDDTDVVVTNSKGSSIAPTGVVLNYLPYILLLLVACTVGFVFFRRRRADY